MTKPEVRDYLEHIVIPDTKAQALREVAEKFRTNGDEDVADLLCAEANAIMKGGDRR